MSHSVRFECCACGWRHDVPPEHIVLVGGIPRADYVPFHACEQGADIIERGSFEAELVTTMPAHNFKMTL